MKSLSVSFTLGKASVPKNINLKHNMREFIARNIDKKKVDDNITYIQEDVEESYNKLFSEAVCSEFNLIHSVQPFLRRSVTAFSVLVLPIWLLSSYPIFRYF